MPKRTIVFFSSAERWSGSILAIHFGSPFTLMSKPPISKSNIFPSVPQSEKEINVFFLFTAYCRKPSRCFSVSARDSQGDGLRKQWGAKAVGGQLNKNKLPLASNLDAPQPNFPFCVLRWNFLFI
eukprot:246114-Rhodomonas_salina.3